MSQYGVAKDQQMADATLVQINNTQTQASQLEGSYAVTASLERDRICTLRQMWQE